MTFAQELTLALAKGGSLSTQQLAVAGGEGLARNLVAFSAHLERLAGKTLAGRVASASDEEAANVLAEGLKAAGYGPAIEAANRRKK